MSMRKDELWFFKECCERISNHGLSEEENNKRSKGLGVFGFPSLVSPRDIINEENFPLNYKRAWYLLEKWSGKDWYDYGVSLDLGWITPEGNEEYKKLDLTKDKLEEQCQK